MKCRMKVYAMKMSKDAQRIVKTVERNLSADVPLENHQPVIIAGTHGSGVRPRKTAHQCNRPGGFLEPQRGGIPNRKTLLAQRV